MPRIPGQSTRALFPQSVIGFTVEANGNIRNMPARFGVGSNEIVLWVIGNVSGHPVTVSLVEFVRGGQPVNPFEWLVGHRVQIADRQMGLIAGLKHGGYQRQNLVDRVKYTIHVAADDNAFEAMEYDPDGDIKP